ncbi:hypothetical protein NE237_006794 [Protea cynaroides]|uniref:HTH myb-type domain-containing protein n=1 Tax=Protea cynaroides TaxID=273540 RepID=A0A9Q0QVT8_9MAGN|nr:hypothetical protein NE237_006794 [Protea cynaroides]
MEDYAERMQRCRDYVETLQEERSKIEVFQRELPFSLELVTQAIDACQQQLVTAATAVCFTGRPQCSEQTSSEGPVLEEFMPIKRSLSSEEEESDHMPKSKDRNDKPLKKTDWLRSVQLWNSDPDPPPKQDQAQRKASVTSDTATSGGVSVDNERGDNDKKEEKDGQSQRKPRRSWPPELHRGFLHALQQLGGSHAATPKQIRALMNVDGLTNDEVKSHLQKYRLHARRPRPAASNP